MMTTKLMAAVLVAASAWSQPAIPETPAGRVFAKWLESFNSNDRAKVQAFIDVHEPQRKNGADQTLQFREMTGGFTLVRIESSEPRELVALLKEKASDTVAKIEFHVDESDPPKTTQVALRAVDPPQGVEKPARLDQEGALAALDKEAAARTAADTFAGTVAVSKNGKIIFEKAYGLANREKKTAATPETQYRIGSMNKMFTAVAALQLVDKGKLALDEPIGKYLTDYPNKDVATKVTLRHLLSHTGGTGDIFTPEFDKKRLELRTLDDYVKLYGTRSLAFEPGSKWAYSNYGFLLAGVLIEKVSGMSYYEYVKKNVFAPAGMTRTDSLPESELVPDRSAGYLKENKQWTPNTDTLPWRGTSAGGGYSTVGDLLRFAAALESGKLLSKQLLEQAHSRQNTLKDAPPYGFGFMNPGAGYGHGGGAPGMNGELRIFPKSGYAVAVLSNLDPPSASRLYEYFANRMPETP